MADGHDPPRAGPSNCRGAANLAGRPCSPPPCASLCLLHTGLEAAPSLRLLLNVFLALVDELARAGPLDAIVQRPLAHAADGVLDGDLDRFRLVARDLDGVPLHAKPMARLSATTVLRAGTSRVRGTRRPSGFLGRGPHFYPEGGALRTACCP